VEREQRERSEFLRYENAAGEVADFHATRHTYISGIVAGGASVKTCQELARHSTPVLTIGRYSHTRLHDLTGALDALPDLQPQEPTPQGLQALIDAWPSLPEPIRAGILAMVKASGAQGEPR
jgi:hypothetical protein